VGHNDGRIGTLIHAADLHLGSPFQGVRSRFSTDETGVEKVKELLSSVSQSFDNLVKITLEEQADILVLAGDIYDGAEQEYQLQEKFVEGLKKLVAGGVKVFIVHGNHDPLITQTPEDIPLPKEVIVFKNTKEANVISVELKSGETVEVAGMSYKTQKEDRHLAKDFFNSEVLSVKNPKTSIGILHTNLSGSNDHADYAPSKIEDLRDAPIGYWALGHVHRRQYGTLDDTNERRWWAYPGNLQGRSTKPSECEPKGCLVVAIHPDGFAEPDFRHCDTVRFGNVSIPLEGTLKEKISDEDALKETLNEALAGAINTFHESREDTKPTIFTVELTGNTSNHVKLDSWDEEGKLLANFRDYIREDFPDCLIMKVKAKYVPINNFEEHRGNDSFAGALFDAMENLNIEQYLSSSDFVKNGPLENNLKTLKDTIEDDRDTLKQIESEVNRILLSLLERQRNG